VAFKQVKQLAESASTSTGLTDEQSAVGTFSVVNLGMYGVRSFAPIVTPPQVCAMLIYTSYFT
jgi:pyruvate/2-oxoglutarate dehydrogenase complex dihydrolipoamide acyltransferase (E2) component